VQQLWSNGQWQPQVQLLQPGGGQVLLQALTLAVDCAGLDSELQQDDKRGPSFSLSKMLSAVAEVVKGESQNVQMLLLWVVVA
jgi:hypothetical protein